MCPCLLVLLEWPHNAKSGTMMSGDGQNKTRHSPQVTTGNGRRITYTDNLTLADDMLSLVWECIKGFGGLEVGVQGNAMITIYECVQGM